MSWVPMRMDVSRWPQRRWQPPSCSRSICCWSCRLPAFRYPALPQPDSARCPLQMVLSGLRRGEAVLGITDGAIMTDLLPRPTQPDDFYWPSGTWRQLRHRIARLVPADGIHPLSFVTPARLGPSRLTAESRLAIAALGVVCGDIGT